MIKNLTRLAVILPVIFFTSCQKDQSGDLPAATDKIKTYTEDITSPGIGHSVVTYNLKYDANDRITSLISASDPGNKIVYTYNTANSFSSDLYNANVLESHEELYLVNNYVDSTYQYNNTGDTATEKFIYNAAKEWVKSYEYSYSKLTGAVLQNTITYTYDGNGNQLKAEGTDTNVDTYEYYPDLVYIHPLIGPALEPPVKHNLIKTHTSTSNGYSIGTAIFTYTFDSNNRISIEKAEVDDGSVVIKTYTYY
ncbi:MAG: hypothetical protein WDO19_23930 [Bacteroidota bacterium]